MKQETAVSTVPAVGKILVIDDNPVIQRAVHFQFRDHGFKVAMTGDLTKAMSIVRSERPDVILMDIHFPDEQFSVTSEVRDGYWAIGWLHYMDEVRDIPIIAISSADPAEVEERVLAAGAVAFFPKPIDRQKLLAKINELMTIKRPEGPHLRTLRMASEKPPTWES